MDLEKAKHMYFSDIIVTDIASELGIPINTLGLMIFGADKSGNSPTCWYNERKRVDPKSITTYKAVKPYLLTMAESSLTDKIVKSVDSLARNKEDLDLDQISTAVGVLEKIDKLGRLERGEATDIISVEQGYTLREIQNGARIVENEIKEITYGEEESESSEDSTETADSTEEASADRPSFPFSR